jgi:hypothetical protein
MNCYRICDIRIESSNINIKRTFERFLTEIPKKGKIFLVETKSVPRRVFVKFCLKVRLIIKNA